MTNVPTTGPGSFFGGDAWARRGESEALAAAAAAGDGIPVGAGMVYFGATAPTGWLLCDGSSFSAVTYPELATLLGGTTLPDLRRRFPMGKAASGTGSTLGGTGGSKDATAVSHNHTQDAHNHTQDAHPHGVTDSGHKHAADGDFGNRWAVTVVSSTHKLSTTGNDQNLDFTDIDNNTTGLTVNNATATNQGATATNQTAGSSGTDANLPPWLAVNYIIRAAA